MQHNNLSANGIDIRIAFLVIAMAVFTFALPAKSHAATTCTFTTDLVLGTQNESVRCLQRYLNSSGFTVSSSGVGSAGSETNQYREKTAEAVRRWQVANGVTPATGTFGAKSRAKYAALAGGTSTQTPASIPTTTTAPAVAARTALTRALQAYQNAFNEVDEQEVVDILGSAQSELFRAVNAYLSGDYANSLTYSINSERLSNNASKNSDDDDDDDEDQDEDEDEVEEALDDANDDLDSARDEIDEANEDGEDTDEADELIEDAEEKLDEAEEAIDDEDYDEAEDLIDEALDLIDEALDEIGSDSGSDDDEDADEAEEALDDVQDDLDDAWERVEEANDDGEDTDDAEDLLEEAEDLLEEAEEAFDDEDYDEVMDLVEEIQDLIDEALDEI